MGAFDKYTTGTRERTEAPTENSGRRSPLDVRAAPAASPLSASNFEKYTLGTRSLPQAAPESYDVPVPAKGWGDMSLQDWREMMTSAGRGIAAGPPIVGPAVDKALDAVVAAPGAVVDYVTGRRPLSEGFRETRANVDRMQRQNPKAYAAGNVAGSVTSTLPLMRAVPRAFGGDSFIGQSLTGAGTAGADAAVRNWTLDPKTIGSAGLVGFAAPAFGSVLAPADAARRAGRGRGHEMARKSPAGERPADKVATRRTARDGCGRRGRAGLQLAEPGRR